MITNILCTCGHLSSFHRTLYQTTIDPGVSPCRECTHCIGFAEWSITDIPYPGTERAKLIGCTCASGINMARAARRERPEYADDCPLHVWVCRRVEPCEHVDTTGTIESGVYAVQHGLRHWACEHCTVPQIECDNCNTVYFDWRVKPEDVGWQKTDDLWTCGTCGNFNSHDLN